MKTNALNFTQVMSNLLKSGITLQEAVSLSKDILYSKKDRNFAEKILKGINEGKTLSEEIESQKKIFSPLYVSLLKIGEESGTLSEVFERLSEYLKNQKARKDSLVHSLIYPVLVLFTAVIVLAVIVFFVFPNLEGIFEAFSENSMELQVKILNLKKSLKITGIIFLLILFLIPAILIVCRTNSKVKYFFDSLVLKIPVISKEIKNQQCYDFVFSMKLLSKSGFTFTQSLNLCSQTFSNLRLKQSLLNIYQKISKGYEAGICFEEERIFPSYLVSWIKLAEQNGDTQKSFSQLYEYFKSENENFSKALSAALEPFFILITGMIVVILIAQFVIPVFKLAGTL